MKMRNDVSFLAQGVLNLYEQQIPNMSLRFLIYLGMIYAKFADDPRRYNMCSRKLQTLPTPKCVCFYNGAKDFDDRTTLKLSDAFNNPSAPEVELRVTMYNVNYGRNRALLDARRPLSEYSFFISAVREGRAQGLAAEDAVDYAFERLNSDSIIKPFLTDNRAKVKRMCITEYNEEEVLAAI